MKPLFIMCSAVLLAACASNAPVVQDGASYDDDSSAQARIRLYGQNQKPTTMVSGIDCENNNRGRKVNVGGSLGDALGSFSGTAKSRSLGIAATVYSQNIGQMNGILSRVIFREFVVPAGTTVNVQASYIGLRNVSEAPVSANMLRRTTLTEGSCNTRMASFVPQAGHDYEVIGLPGRRCAVAVYEVGTQGEQKPVQV